MRDVDLRDWGWWVVFVVALAIGIAAGLLIDWLYRPGPGVVIG